MGLTLQLRDSLRDRYSQAVGEFAAGESLKTVLERDLLAVESSLESKLLTSILLLDPDGKRLWHGAAPSLPDAYCQAIDGSEIGAVAGSCGTAAYLQRAVYVSDVETDPLWNDYRQLALQHGLRACWSTPIHDPEGSVLGTFAIYHLTPRSPTREEVQAIRLITDHVARAILESRSREVEQLQVDDIQMPRRVGLKLVGDDGPQGSDSYDEPKPARAADERFEAFAAKLEQFAQMVESPKLAQTLGDAAAGCRRLAADLRDGRVPTEHDK